MAMTVHVDIVSAEKEFFSGLAQMVVATGSIGEIGRPNLKSRGQGQRSGIQVQISSIA